MLKTWKGLSPLQRREARIFYLWIMPWFIGFLIWQLWPLLQSLWLSFTDYQILNAPNFTGLENLQRLLHDDDFFVSLGVTLGYVLGVVPIGTFLALMIAVALAQNLRGVNFWRTIYFLPSVVSGVAAAVMWWYVFNPEAGLVNSLLGHIGIKGPGWLSDPAWALPSIIIIAWWAGVGSQMVIYLAGIKGIPVSLYEAAEIDGARSWAKFQYITLPLLSPTILFNMVVGLIGAFQVFDTAYTITRGGPNKATLVYVYHVYQEAFVNQNMGYASLLSWVLFLIILALTLIVLRISQTRIYYEAGPRP